MGWHEHPSEPAIQSVISTEPEAPAGITHAPELQTPLAQSGPVSQVVFGSGTDGIQSPPLHSPLRQSLGCVHGEPAGAPGIPPEPAPAAFSPPFESPADDEPPVDFDPPTEIEPPSDVDPPIDTEPFPAALDPPRPPLEPLLLCSLELHANAIAPTMTNPESPAYARRCRPTI
jgi:hypothetical protein